MSKVRDAENNAYLAEVMRAQPTADLRALRRIVFNNLQRGPIEDRKRWCDALTDLVYRRLTVDPQPEPEPLSDAERQAEEASAAQQAKDRLSDLAPILFMRLPTPFGKPLGELTGKEGRKLAGWMGAIFKGVPDGKRLCDVKSEAALREVWAKRK